MPSPSPLPFRQGSTPQQVKPTNPTQLSPPPASSALLLPCRACVHVPAGKWTVQQAAELSVAAPTITASLDGRYMSAVKEERVAAAAFYEKVGLKVGVGGEGNSGGGVCKCY